MEDNIKIRKATKKELKEVKKLDLELSGYIKKNFNKYYNLKTISKRLDKVYLKISKNFGKYIILIALDNNKIIGFVNASIDKEDVSWYGCKTVWINEVYLKEKYRKHNLGARLLKELLKITKKKGVKIYHLYTDSKNKRAISLWKKFGFKEQATMFMKVDK